MLTGLAHGRYFSFEKIDLTGIKQVELGFQDSEKLLIGTTVEIRVGSASGEIIGSGLVGEKTVVEISKTNGWQNVFFVFKNEKEQEKEIGLLDWVLFDDGL
ncbi:MAG: hypothetical protein R2788_16430 [Saprospiraceae bacterium]